MLASKNKSNYQSRDVIDEIDSECISDDASSSEFYTKSQLREPDVSQIAVSKVLSMGMGIDDDTMRSNNH